MNQIWTVKTCTVGLAGFSQGFWALKFDHCLTLKVKLTLNIKSS